MAATRVEASGIYKNRTRFTSLLGSDGVSANVHTWNTYIYSYIDKTGRGYVEIRRYGKMIYRYDIDEEENA